MNKDGTRIHADVNGACNIVQKASSGAFAWHGTHVKLYPWRIDASNFDHREKSPDIFGWNGAGVRHHPRLVYNPAPS